MNNPFKSLTKKEWVLWIGSLIAVVITNLLAGETDPLTLAASCVGVTSLIFAAKGNIWGQIIAAVFCVLYGIISWQFHYWGEFITYTCMTMPLTLWATFTWLKNPSASGNEVAINKLTRKTVAIVAAAAAAVTLAFYWILRALDTPNLGFSTVAITTSFTAETLTMLRSPWYAVAYGANDLVLIVLWVLASVKDPRYIPVVANFSVFLINDIYAFISWRKREKEAA